MAVTIVTHAYMVSFVHFFEVHLLMDFSNSVQGVECRTPGVAECRFDFEVNHELDVHWSS